MIKHGIEYQRPTSLNMRILADHVTYSFLAFMKSIFHFCLGCYCGGYSQNRRSNLSSFDLLSPLTLSRVQFFSDRRQTWWGHTLGQDLGRVRSWETWLVKWVLNELINYLDLLSPLPQSWVQFFFDRGQTWWGFTLGQNLSRVHSWETWLIKWVLNELINYFDLLRLLPLSWV